MLKKQKKVKQKLKRIIITSYKFASESARLLQGALRELCPDRKVLRVRKESLTFTPRQVDHHILWGNCSGVAWADPQQELAKAIAANKLKTFQKFKEANVPHPEWTTDPLAARLWDDVVCRATLNGHSGEGITLWNKEDAGAEGPIPQVPLYVKYKKKKHEFRVHVFNDEILDVVQKKRKAGFEGRNNQIRNYANGWVFCRENINEPEDLRTVALAACAALDLKFGAVDIIYNEHENKCYALEVNTAPGIEGTTLQKYAQRFKKELSV